MSKQIRGTVLIVLGVLMMAAAGVLYAGHLQEAEQAGENARQLLTALNREIEHNREQVIYDAAVQERSTGQMAHTTLQGYDLVGIIRVPSVGVELPVLDSWSYALLKLSACRYSGSVEGDDLILLGHNYKKHFAPLKDVQVGALVELQDVNGTVHRYKVAATQVLDKTQLEELTGTEHALTVFTCTTGGTGRFVVRCDREE